MNAGSEKRKALMRPLWALAFVNVTLWTLSMVALAVVTQESYSPKGIAVILAAGLGVGVTIISLLRKAK